MSFSNVNVNNYGVVSGYLCSNPRVYDSATSKTYYFSVLAKQNYIGKDGTQYGDVIGLTTKVSKEQDYKLLQSLKKGTRVTFLYTNISYGFKRNGKYINGVRKHITGIKLGNVLQPSFTFQSVNAD